MKKAAVIHDLSGFGKCSLTAAIPVLSALGVQCCPVATAVLTGQTGYPCYHCTDLTAMLPDYIDAWGKNNAHFDAIYSGFLTGSPHIPPTMSRDGIPWTAWYIYPHCRSWRLLWGMTEMLIRFLLRGC